MRTVASALLFWCNLETEALDAVLADEAQYPGTYYAETLTAVCLILQSRCDRQEGYAFTAEISEETAFNYLCAALHP